MQAGLKLVFDQCIADISSFILHCPQLTALVRNVMHKIISPRIRKGSALDLDVHRVYPTPEERTREATELEKSKDDQA